MELTSPTEFAKQKVQAVQEYTLLAAQSVGNLFRKPIYFADMVQQADLIGVGSLPIVVLTGFFTGGVLALQTANTLQRFGSITLIGQLVSTSMVRELGPVLTGLMVAGRNSSGMASELGRWSSPSRLTPCGRWAPIRSRNWLRPALPQPCSCCFFSASFPIWWAWRAG